MVLTDTTGLWVISSLFAFHSTTRTPATPHYPARAHANPYPRLPRGERIASKSGASLITPTAWGCSIRRIDSFTLVDISATISSDFEFRGAAAAGDGRVVFAPYKADGVGVFPPPPGTDWCTCCESKMTRLGLNVDRVCVLPPL